MLQKLLTEIRQGGTLRPAALAERLDVSVGLVEAMLSDLERMGILVQVEAACNSQACGGCPLSSGCTQPTSARKTWMLRTSPPRQETISR